MDSKVTSLIEALATATRGDAVLNALIEREIRTPDWRERVGKEEICMGDAGLVRDSRADDYLPNIAPRYSESIDAAMALVPAGLGYSFDNLPPQRPWADIVRNGCRLTECGSHGATPALALCIAALKARETADAR